jgi:hypothetical protein
VWPESSNELDASHYSETGVSMPKKTVFISATSIDLSEYVKAVKEALEKAGYHTNDMSKFGANPDEPRVASLDEVETADYFVGLYARRYGYIPDGDARSVTEQEYHHAREKPIPVFAFIGDVANTDLTSGPGEDDGSEEAIEKQAKLKTFLFHIETSVVRATFTGKDDLATKVLASLRRYETRKTVLQPPTNTLRIHLQKDSCELLHNDKPLDTATPAFDASFRQTIESYARAKRYPSSVITRDIDHHALGSAEIMADRMGKRLGELIFTHDSAAFARELISTWQ